MSTEQVGATIHRRWAADLEPDTLYALLKLRVDVFVVEQSCPYPELDGRDLEPRTRHYWLSRRGDPESVLGCVRLLKEPDGSYRIGRLCVAPEVRGHGLGRRLMAAVLAEVGEGRCVLDAQAAKADFYADHGFVPIGEAYDWDGIAHVPMHRLRRELAS